MSLLGAIATYYNEGSSSDLTTLHTALGSGRLYADYFPTASPAKPFCILSEVQTQVSPSDMAKGVSRNARIEVCVVSFMVFGTGRAQVEAILEALDNVYTGSDAQLSITGRNHMATMFIDRTSTVSENGWEGNLLLGFKSSKAGD